MTSRLATSFTSPASVTTGAHLPGRRYGTAQYGQPRTGITIDRTCCDRCESGHYRQVIAVDGS
jgi:hypothetical protein